MWAKEYFTDLNRELKESGIKQKYFFHFLTPESYKVFEEYLLDGRLFDDKFKSKLEDSLEKEK